MRFGASSSQRDHRFVAPSVNMCALQGCLQLLVCTIYFFLSVLDTHLSIAADTISLGVALSGNQTIVSKEGNFELGFFTPGNSCNHYIGIWYRKISKQTVIWVANREIPIADTWSSELKIAKDGNLVLLNELQKTIWSTNSTLLNPNFSFAVLLDTGNLVLKESLNSSAVAWQSFDYPTDSLLPGAWLRVNKITGEFHKPTSWRNSEDPAPGSFSVSTDPDGPPQFFEEWNGSRRYGSTGVWDGSSFDQIPELKMNFNYNLIENRQWWNFSYATYNHSIITRSVIDLSGQLKQWTWLDDIQDWVLVWSLPTQQCDVYSVCGSFGICNAKSLPFCSCLQGFRPASVKDWNLNDWTSGCERKTRLSCSNRSSDKFLAMPNIHLPDNSQTLVAQSIEECELACLNDCSCTAYSYSSNCSTWNGDLRNAQQLYEGDTGYRTLHLRLAASELLTSSNRSRKVIGPIVGAAAALIILFVVASGLLWRRQRVRAKTYSVDSGLISFAYADLRRATNNFSERIGGGGFGSVFKGVLPDLTAIAVKKLEGLKQGEKQFRTEVSTLGMVHHVNLVRLRGFCSEGTKRLLVYDYMAGGCLASLLFKNDSKVSDWTTRYRIILGIARGLSYLHEMCRKCIIHCDIKPENILLDAEFHPKISDFGMAKLIGHDFSQVLTTTRGTIGYLAPEWILGLPITPKADVYSFGMMVFEVISGKRNIEEQTSGEASFFPAVAAHSITEGEIDSILDHKLKDEVDMEELRRACKVACWCIQDSEDCRPSMGHVVQILERVVEVDMPPVPHSLLNLIKEE